MSIRTEQVESQILQLLGEILNKEIEFPENHLITVSRVSIAPDLRAARAYVSVLPFESADEVLKLLEVNRVEIQKELHHNLAMKFSPVLSFIHDKQEEYADEIERLIDQEVGE